MDRTHFSLAEASGLSRNNKISASALVKVLRDVSNDFSSSPEFLASLGIGGVDGTMKEKFTDQKVKRRIRAKTGNLRGVNSLAGYGISPNGRMFIFAVLVNSQQKGTGFIDHGDKIIPRNYGFASGLTMNDRYARLRLYLVHELFNIYNCEE